MRRFWKEVALEQSTYGHTIRLDGRAVKTPMRHELVLPTKPLADAVADEWAAVGEMIDPGAMPLTGFANAALDHVAVDRDGFVAAIAAYAESDSFCYRADAGDALAKHQAEIWDPWLEWARGRYDVSFSVVFGLMPELQPQPTLDKLRAAVAARGTYELAAMAKLAHLAGSLVAVLALVERAVDANDIWRACCLEEIWQEQNWGRDHWAEKNRLDRGKEFLQAARFLHLLAAA